MNKLRIISICLLIVMLTSAFTPGMASDDRFKLTVKNQTGESFWITFTGPEIKWHQTIDGRNSVDLLKGDYKVAYFACGEYVEDSLTIKKPTEMVIKCQTAKADSESNALVKLKVNNQTGTMFWITFTGATTKWHQAPVGVSTVELPKGDYEYSYWACNQQNDESVKVKPGEVLKIKCGATGSGDAASGKVKVTINNTTGENFWISFTGTEAKWHQAAPGKTVVELTKGEYTYTYTACGAEHEEYVKIKKEEAIKIKCGNNNNDEAKGDLKKITVQNSTWGTVTLYLTGPQSYTFYVPTGNQKLDVVKGTYSYTVYGCGGAVGYGHISTGEVLYLWCY